MYHGQWCYLEIFPGLIVTVDCSSCCFPTFRCRFSVTSSGVVLSVLRVYPIPDIAADIWLGLYIAIKHTVTSSRISLITRENELLYFIITESLLNHFVFCVFVKECTFIVCLFIHIGTTFLLSYLIHIFLHYPQKQNIIF